MSKIEELREQTKDILDKWSKGGYLSAMAKITLAAIEDAQRYKKDENGFMHCPMCGGFPDSGFEDRHAIVECCVNVRSRILYERYTSADDAKAEAMKIAKGYWNTRADNAAVRAVLEVTGGGE